MIKWDLAGHIPQLNRQEESRKSALPALIERIKAYPDRKMDVRFRIGGKFEGTHGGQDLYPHESTYPVRGITESTGINIKLDSDLAVLSYIDSMNQ